MLVLALAGQILPVGAANDIKDAAVRVNTTLTVDESTVIKQADKRLLGFNNDANWVIESQLGLGTAYRDDEWVDAYHDYGMKAPLVRGFFHNLDWMDTVGKNRDITGGSALYTYGMPEWIKSVLKITPDAQFSFCINVEDSVFDLQNLVRYLLFTPDDPRAVDANGVNWAQVRVDDGLVDPVPVACLELGNETDLQLFAPRGGMGNYSNQEIAECAQQYVDWCNPIIDGIRQVSTDVKLSALLISGGAEDYSICAYWDEKIMGELGAKVDYIILHWYHGTGNDGSHNANLSLLFDQWRLNYALNLMEVLPEDKRPKLYMSEHACWVGQYTTDPDTGLLSGMVTSLRGTLATAELVNRMANTPAMELASYHSLSDSLKNRLDFGGNSWGAMRRYDQQGEVQLTVVGEYFRMAYDAFGDQVVKCTFSEPEPHHYAVPEELSYDKRETTQIITATAHTTEDGGMRLIFANQHINVGHNITFVANGAYKLEKEVILTDDNTYVDNNMLTPDSYYATTNLVNANTKFQNYYVPPQSVVALYLAPMDAEYTDPDRGVEVTMRDDNGTAVTCTDGVFFAEIEALEGRAFEKSTGAIISVVNSEGEIVALDWKDFLRQRTSFSCVLPESGNYTLRISDGTTTYEKSFNAQVVKSKRAHVSLISIDGCDNNTYQVDYTVDFGVDARVGDTYTVSIEDMDGGVHYYTAGQKEVSDTVQGEAHMPTWVPGGRYKLVVAFGDYRYEKEFSFLKASELVRISAAPVKGNGDVYTLNDYKLGEDMTVSLTNISDQPQTFRLYASAYGPQGGMIGASNSDTSVTLAVGETKEVSLAVNATGTEPVLIKFFTWAAGLTPLNDIYFTK